MNALETLRSTTYKVTRPRRLIIEYLSKQRRPKTIQEIYGGLKKNIDQVTVYRAVELLQSLNIIFSEFLLDEQRFYIAATPHHHITCRNCKKIDCLPCTTEVPEPKGFTNTTHQISITGLCTACA